MARALVRWVGAFALLSAPALAEVCRLSGHPEWTPLSYAQADGAPLQGVAVEAVRDALHSVGAAVEIGAVQPWNRVLGQLEAGRIDVVASAYHTQARARRYLYSEPYYQVDIVLFALRDRTWRYRALADLENRQGVIILGDSYGETFDRHARRHLNIEHVEGLVAQFAAVARGRSDYGVISHLNFLWAKADLDPADRMELLAPPIQSNPIHAMFSRASPCVDLLPAVNAVLTAPEARERMHDRILARMRDPYGY